MVHFEEGIELRRHIEQNLPPRHPFRVELELPSMESILRYVAQGFGCTILPRFAFYQFAHLGLQTRQLSPLIPDLMTETCVHQRRQPSRASQAFQKMLLDFSRPIGKCP